MIRYRGANTKPRQSNPHTQPTQNQKIIKDLFKKNQSLPNKPAPSTYVSPQRPSKEYSSSKFRSLSSIKTNQPRKYRNTSPTPKRQWHTSPTPFRSQPTTPNPNPPINQNTHSPSPYNPCNSNPHSFSPNNVNQLTTETEEPLHIAETISIMDDDQFHDCVNFFDIGIIKTANALDETKPGFSWYLSLNLRN